MAEITRPYPDSDDDKCPECGGKVHMMCRCWHPKNESNCRFCAEGHEWHWEDGKQLKGHKHVR